MARKQRKPEEIVAKPRQVEVLAAQGKTVAGGARATGVAEATHYRWRSDVRSQDILARDIAGESGADKVSR